MNKPEKNFLSFKLPLLLCLLCAFALGIKSFSEPDLWWQITTGQWILKHGAIPKTDIFSFTMTGVEWINIKWMFEVLAALVARWFGPESVYIIQAIISVILFYFLYKVARIFLNEPGIGNTSLFASAFVFTFLVTAVAIEYRINGRPEMFSHLFTVIYLLILLRTRQRASNQIYFLIPLQVIWCNIHEAFGIGIVLVFIFSFAAWIEWWIERKHSSNHFKHALKISFVSIFSVLAVLVNPNGKKLLIRPLNILQQVQENKYTVELLSFTDSFYWQKEAFLVLFILLLSIAGLYLFLLKKEKAKMKSFIEKLGFGYAITIVAFLYLALSAYRNIIFLVLVLFPLFFFATYYLTHAFIRKNQRWTGFFKVASVALPVVFYLLIVSNKFYTITERRVRFGLEVTSYNNPVGAARYIEERGLKNKKCFSDYLTSSYLLWKFQPDFKTYIDLRDLDIFPASHFTKFYEATQFPNAYFALDSIEHFDYVVLFRPQFSNLHAYLYNDSIYAMTYVDAVAAVYEKTDDFTRADIFSRCTKVKASAFAATVNKILNPFYEPYNYRTIDYDMIAADYYIATFQFHLAKARAKKYLSRKGNEQIGHDLLTRIDQQEKLLYKNMK